MTCSVHPDSRRIRLLVAVLFLWSAARTQPNGVDVGACRSVGPHAQLARAWLIKGAYGKSVREYRHALALCADEPAWQLDLVRALIGARQFTAAEGAAASVLQHDPHSREAQFLLGYAYFLDKQFSKSEGVLSALVDRLPRDAGALKLLGMTRFSQRNYDPAQKDLSTSLAIDPHDGETIYYLAQLYYATFHFKEAARMFARMIDATPQIYQGYEGLGLSYHQMGRTSEALSALYKALAVAKQNQHADDAPYVDLAQVLNEQNWAEALPYARRAVSLKPASSRNRCLLAAVLIRGGQYEAAREQLRRAELLDPWDPQTHYRLAQVYQKLGNRVAARRESRLFARIKASSASSAKDVIGHR